MEEYFTKVLLKSYSPFHLFLFFDINDRSILAAYQSPFNIVKYFWERHTKHHPESAYSDGIVFMEHNIRLFEYRSCLDFLAKLEKQETFSRKDIDDLSFLFMQSFAVSTDDAMFGYVKIPEQREMLKTVLDKHDYDSSKEAINAIIRGAVDTKARRIEQR